MKEMSDDMQAKLESPSASAEYINFYLNPETWTSNRMKESACIAQQLFAEMKGYTK